MKPIYRDSLVMLAIVMVFTVAILHLRADDKVPTGATAGIQAGNDASMGAAVAGALTGAQVGKAEQITYKTVGVINNAAGETLHTFTTGKRQLDIIYKVNDKGIREIQYIRVYPEVNAGKITDDEIKTWSKITNRKLTKYSTGLEWKRT